MPQLPFDKIGIFWYTVRRHEHAMDVRHPCRQEGQEDEARPWVWLVVLARACCARGVQDRLTGPEVSRLLFEWTRIYGNSGELRERWGTLGAVGTLGT